MQFLFFNDDLVVVIKPVGLDSEHQVPAAIKEVLESDVYTIHRLDKNVGGLMVYALNKKAAAEFSKGEISGIIEKEYLAMIHGTPEESGVLEDYLFKDSRKNKVFVVKKQRTGVKKAKLEYTRLTEGEQSLVRVRLHTGRSHQIRVQFASRGYPLVGDHKYGSKSEVKEPMLFSSKISFSNRGDVYTFEAKPDWAEI